MWKTFAAIPIPTHDTCTSFFYFHCRFSFCPTDIMKQAKPSYFCEQEHTIWVLILTLIRTRNNAVAGTYAGSGRSPGHRVSASNTATAAGRECPTTCIPPVQQQTRTHTIRKTSKAFFCCCCWTQWHSVNNLHYSIHMHVPRCHVYFSV